ncbi:MAG: hypothetical protein EA341_03470 [Mongoliibacter sp.]|uniref:hypothetical protein n=1 Tax=Mongoliibacter sp. TaxID=2022438 RepID=UPI0012F00D64|nr:hypothetical protein [Mongoliibacter sp.]TVP52256.1 MAG: hypothetical protein EA341_03470 [Mongoliibacter sp.]
MGYKVIISSFLITFFYVLSIYNQESAFIGIEVDPEQGRVEHRVVVKIINNEWRVVLEGNNSKSDVTLRRGDRIRWVVEGSDASFAFPDSRIFGHETREVKAGNPLVMAVSANSPKGTFPYTVFIHESMTYARGQSPPRIIVRN